MAVTTFEAEETEAAVEEAPSTGPTIELAFVAAVLARPDLLAAVSPDLRAIGDVTARAMLSIVAAHGSAYTAPMAMLAALESLPQTIDGEVATQILSIVPEPEDVELSTLLTLKADVEGAAAERHLTARLERLTQQAGKRPAEEVVAEMRNLANEFQRGQVGRDHTAAGVASRMGEATAHIRWKCGALDLDEAWPGIGPDGQPSYGMLAQGEILVLAARYGAGKTRIALNWAVSLLDQGASVAIIALEDDDVSFAARMMAIKADIEPWKITMYAAGGLAFLGSGAEEEGRKCEEALEWWSSLGNRIRIYDGNAKMNIFRFDQAVSLMETDKALHATTHVLLDYVNAWTGETSEIEQYAFGLRAVAARNNLCLIELSQLANDTIKFGSAPGMVAAKGSGAWGAACHIGLEIMDDPSVGQRELGLVVKKARGAGRRTVYAGVNESTGRVKAWYGTPMHLELPQAGDKKKGAKR